MWHMNILQEAAWLPCWLQSLGTNGSIEFVKESQSQAPSYQEAKVGISRSEIILFFFFLFV